MPLRKKALIILLVLGIVAVSFSLYQNRAAIYAELNDWKLIPQSEAFTELYFDDAANLPRATVAGQAIAFTFTIQNSEGVTTTYPYLVYFVYPDGQEVPFTNGSVTLASNASTSIPVTYQVNTTDLTGKVVVDLPSLADQQIDFLLPDTNP